MSTRFWSFGPHVSGKAIAQTVIRKCCGNGPCRECMVLWKWSSQTNAAEAQAADNVAAEGEAAAGVGNYTYLHSNGGCSLLSFS